MKELNSLKNSMYTGKYLYCTVDNNDLILWGIPNGATITIDPDEDINDGDVVLV